MGIFSLVIFGAVVLARDFFTTIRVAVRLHILLSNINGSARLRGEAAKVSKFIINLQLNFDTNGVFICSKERNNLMKKFCCYSDSSKL